MEAEHDGEDEEEDEAFARFQQKMNNLIAEGQAALTSQADMEGIEDDEEELRFKRMHSGVEKSRNGWEHSSSGIGSSNLLSFGDSTPSFKSYSNNQMFNGPSSNSTQSFTSNFSNPTSSPPPEPSKTLSFASHTPTSGGAYDFSFRPTFGGDTSTSINDSLFRNPVSGQTAQQPFTPTSPSPLGGSSSRPPVAAPAPFVFGASTPSTSGPARGSGSNSPYRRPQGGNSNQPRMRTQPRWVG